MKRTGIGYMLRYNNKLKWNAFIYTDQNTQNFKLVNKTIKKVINKFNGKNKDEKLNGMKNFAYKNHMILLFVRDND